MLKDFAIPVLFLVASITCFVFCIKSWEDDARRISLRTIVLSVLTFVIAISGVAYIKFYGFNINEKGKTDTYIVYSEDGNEAKSTGLEKIL